MIHPRTFVLVSFLATIPSLAVDGSSDPSAPAPPRQELALRMLADVAFRLDTEGIELARDRLAAAPADESPAEKARRLYLVALAEWHLGQALSAQPEKALASARRADDALRRALDLDPELAQAWVLRNRVNYQRYLGGESLGEEGVRLYQETLTRARELAAEDPLVMLLDGVDAFYTPTDAGGDPIRGLTRVQQAISAFEAAAPADPHADIWLPVARNWLGSMYLARGQVVAARKAFTEALDVRPDYAYVRRSLLPQTEPVSPASSPAVAADEWVELATDPGGDGRVPGLADLRSLSWHHDDYDRLWFRLELAAPPDPERGFGVNVALDVDGSQETGADWWASSDRFRYDRLLTVWVTRDDSGQFHGAVGLADSREVAEGRFTTSPVGTVEFAVDPADRALLVGVDRKALAATAAIRLVATVGSPTNWSDTAPDAGWVTLG